MNKNLPDFPYGAVYFRYSNPPEEDWERDYQTAKEDGMNIFRHWFLWSGIETAPGEFDWSKYDKQLDLAAKNGLKTIIAEMTMVAPEWAYNQYGHARYEKRDGSKLDSGMHVSCVTGGAPGLCFDNDDVKDRAEDFLRKLVSRYKDHPGLGGYDVWNECNLLYEDICYCPATAEKFRSWLRERYGSLDQLGEAWHRPSFSQWSDVNPPRRLGPYPDALDWLRFRVDDAYRLMDWRVNTIKAIDPDHPVTAHGQAASLTSMAPRASHDWKAADRVDIYGYTWGSSRHGDESWKQWHGTDLVRASTKEDKPFWYAEAYAGPLWMQAQVVDKPRNEGRIARAEDVRLWNMRSFAAGARGLFYCRWRPLLDGPLFGAFGPYGMDGSKTARSEMSAKIGKWATAQKQQDMWKSSPIKGDIGILFVPESQRYCYVQQNDTRFYADAAQGAYQGFFYNNIQPDWVHIDDLNDYDFLYLPFPIMLKKETADKLKKWVKAGGKLISEGCPAYFGDRGRVGTRQPNYGLDELFGARESYVEFTPDLLDDLSLRVLDNRIFGSTFLQKYELKGGQAVGWYEDGSVASVENDFGEGRALLVGTFPGAGYAHHPGEKEGSNFFGDLLEWAGREPHLRVSDPRITARLHAGSGGAFLWLTNPAEIDLRCEVTFSSQWGPFKEIEVRWGNSEEAQLNNGRKMRCEIERRNAMVIELYKN